MVPVFNEFLAWVPTEVVFVELCKLILFAAAICFVWTSLKGSESFFIGLGLATSWPFATALSPAVTAALALVDIRSGTTYFIALSLAFLLLQIALVKAWIRLRKHDSSIAS
jgi:hypothetical protein